MKSGGVAGVGVGLTQPVEPRTKLLVGGRCEHPPAVDLLLVDPAVAIEGLADERGAIVVHWEEPRAICRAS